LDDADLVLKSSEGYKIYLFRIEDWNLKLWGVRKFPSSTKILWEYDNSLKVR
jgi:hypothetical protein